MIFVYFIIGLITLYVCYELHKFWRMPVYNKVYNMWQEDVEKTGKANIVIIMMCIVSFFMGVLSVLMVD